MITTNLDKAKENTAHAARRQLRSDKFLLVDGDSYEINGSFTTWFELR